MINIHIFWFNKRKCPVSRKYIQLDFKQVKALMQWRIYFNLLTNNSLALPGILVQLRYYAFFQYFLFFATIRHIFQFAGLLSTRGAKLTLSKPVEGRLCPPNNTGSPQISGLPKALIWYSVVIWLACNYWLCIALGANQRP